MRTQSLALVNVCLAVSSFPLVAQSTWIVDAQNGPGTNFNVLQTAFDNVADGDTLIVRAGTYQASATGKGLTILGEGTVIIQAIPNVPCLTLTGLAANRTFVLKNVSLRHQSGQVGLSLTQNLGRTQIENCTIYSGVSGPYAAGAAATISSCAAVTFLGCTLGGGANKGLVASNSDVVVVSSSVTGRSGYSDRASFVSSSPAIALTASTLAFVESSAQGGLGGVALQSGTNPAPPSDAITATGGLISVHGAATISAGTLAGAAPTHAISANGTEVRLHTSATLTGAQLGKGVFGVTPRITPHLAALVTIGSRYGGKLQLTLTSASGDAFAVVAGRPQLPVVLPIGSLAVDLAVVIPILNGTQGVSGATTISIPLPISGVRGMAIALQGIDYDAVGSELWLSNPVVTVID